MLLLELVLFLLLCAVALGWVARHFRFPYPIALVIGGILLGFVPKLPQFPLDPQLILVLVLPPILYQAALLTSWSDFRANLAQIGRLAIGLVLATTLIVGAALKWLLPDLPWAAAFAFGAIVSPPDAVAATAILSRLSIPRRIVTVLEGESLVNDASGLVLYKFAVAATLTGTFSLAQASLDFVGLSLGGLALGIALAFVFIAIHRRLGDPFIEVLMTLAVPYVTYVLAESVHVSGVLAVVAAGLVRGRHSPEIVSAEMRIMARSMWNFLVFLLNSLVFILIGIQLSDMTERLAHYSNGQLIGWGAAISVVAILVRFAWVYLAAFLPRLFGLGRGEAAPRGHRRELGIVSWCGMRGIVSLAAALALPEFLPDGRPFPHRDLIVFLTFFVITVTLVGQGLSLPALIRRLRVGADRSIEEEARLVRMSLGAAALAAIDALAAREDIAAALADPVRLEARERAALVTSQESSAGAQADLARRLRLAALRGERAELIRLWRADEIGDEVLRHIEEILDYQEAQL